MMGRFHCKFMIALIAQVVFCLVAAPIVLAEQWKPPETSNAPRKTPSDSRVTFEAAFDASNVRPEEVSSAEQKKSRPRSGGSRAIASAQKWFQHFEVGSNAGESGSSEYLRTGVSSVGSALADAIVPTQQALEVRGVPSAKADPTNASSIVSSSHATQWAGNPAFVDAWLNRPGILPAPQVVSPASTGIAAALLPGQAWLPAVQPTGPPIL